MKKMMILALSSVMSWSAQAHVIWLEREAPSAPTYAYFGEYTDRDAEDESGFLKKLSKLKATHNNKQFSAIPESNRLRFNTKASGDVQLSTQVVYEQTLVHFGAKNGFGSQKTPLPLDVVAVAGAADQIQINFEGKPAANTKLKLYGPSLWEKTYTSDSRGQIQLEKPWRGQYLIEVSHEDKMAGNFKKEAYKQRYWVTTLSFKH